MNHRTILVAFGLAFGPSLASAIPIEYTFTANGVTDGASQQATAVFTFDSSDLTTFTIELTNNAQPTAKIASLLDGFEFSFSEAVTSLALDSVSAMAVVDCSDSADPCPPPDDPAPALYGWGTLFAGSDAALGAGITNGGFSYKPYGIVNANYDAPGGDGGLSNGQHNPLLIGPVTFTFSVSGLTTVPDISSVMFLFGTVPDSQDGTTCTNGDCGTPDEQVPEPHTAALLGLGLLSLAWVARRRRRIA